MSMQRFLVKYGLIAHGFAVLSGLVSGSMVSAQITPDTTLPVGERSQVSGNPTIRINGGAIRGTNLFHSFSQFSVANGQTAFFNNAVNITNIIGRVTGNSSSFINGTLRANGNANLFLINPNGITFGENARLNIGGSFVASTASAVQFGNQGSFSAVNPEAPGLLTINPSALLFNQISSGRIENRSVARAGANPAGGRLSGLQVRDDRSLLLMGGDILMDGGGLNALGGQVELAAIAGTGSVEIVNSNNALRLNVSDSLVLGNIQLTNQAQINTSGNRGGLVRLQGDRITLANQSEILADTFGNQDGLGISIRANQLRIQDGSQISASAIEGSQGNSGGIQIDAKDLVSIVGSGSGTRTPNAGGGGGGGGNNNNGGGGNNNGGSGNNSDRPSKLASDARGAGRAGNLIINTRRLELRDGGKISSSTIDRPGDGNIAIQATDSIDLIGTSSQRQRASGISVQTRGTGRAGDISLVTKRLRILDGAELSASTLGSGAGGNISVFAQESVEIAGTSRDGLLISRLDAETGRPRDTRDAGQLIGTGAGGNIQVTTDRLTIRDNAEISVSGISPLNNSGDAGNLEINARVIELDRGGAIAAVTTSGNGGDITLNVKELLLLRNNSLISTTAGTAEAGGNGGNLTINIPNGFIVGVLSENSDIRANAFTGNGGNISITAQGIYGLRFQPADTLFSDITASSRFGLNGTVVLNTPDVDPSRSLSQLADDLVDLSGLVEQSLCAVGEGSEFARTGRGGLPDVPTDYPHSASTWEDWRTPFSDSVAEQDDIAPVESQMGQQTGESRSPLIEAQTWMIDPNGDVHLIAASEEPPISQFASPQRSRCLPNRWQLSKFESHYSQLFS